MDLSDLISYNSTSGEMIKTSPSYSAYKVTNKLYYQNTVNDSVITPSFNTANNISCFCNNVITKVNYDFMMRNDSITGYKVVYFYEDIFSRCGQSEYVPVTYSIRFKGEGEDYNYDRSGNPGYIKGKPLMTGNENKFQIFNNVTGLNDTTLFIDQFTTPRIINGVGQNNDDRGLCYHNIYIKDINQEKSENTRSDSIYEENTSSISFFNMTKLSELPTDISGLHSNPLIDSSLTYQDRISYGCVDKLNIIGLQYFCVNQLWKQKTMFDVINDITYISKFGNPNRHLILDWLQVDPFTIDSYQSTWDSINNKCTIPSVMNIDILYATFGMVNNTQHSVFKVKYRLDYTYWWSKNPDDANTKDNFFTHMNINFFRIPQEKVWWYAPGPGFVRLSKNILYPFRFGTTQYGISSTAYSLNFNLFHILILLIFLI